MNLRWKVVAALVAIIALALLARQLPVADWVAYLQERARDAGAAGYVIYVIAYAICCVLLIPALALTLAAGATFGFVPGAIVNVIGATLGATAAFLLARTVLRRRIERMVEANPKLTALDRAFTQEGAKIMWLVRLSGFPPFTWTNYALGLTGVRVAPYIVITFLGIIPGSLAFTYAGAAGAAALTGTGNRIALIVTAVGAVLVSVVIARIALKALKRAAA